MSSKQTADRIIEHLEALHHKGHGFNRIFGSMKRKEFASVADDIAAIIDGKEVSKPELKPLPEAKPTKPASKPATPGKPGGAAGK